MISSFLYAGSALILTFFILQIALPNFNRQKRFAEQARLNLLREDQIQLEQDKVTSYIEHNIIGVIDNRFGLDRILGVEFRKKYQLLDKEMSYERFLADAFGKSCIIAAATLVLPYLFEDKLYIAIAPVALMLSFLFLFKEIDAEYKKRQSEIVKDIPNLIDKMMITLEAGKPFITTFQQIQRSSSSPRMKKMLNRLIANMGIMRQSDAIEQFARDTGIPEMYQFAVAVKIGIENGYEEAQPYFQSIKHDLRELRKTALEELTRSKPEKIKYLYAILALHAVICVGIAFFEIFKKVNQI